MNKQPITEHLGELRKRILVSMIALGLGFVICFHFSEHIFSLLILPMNNSFIFSLSYPFFSLETLGDTKQLYFLELTEPLWMHFKISLISAFVLASPLVFFELWQFISPGLHAKEKKYIFPFVIATTSLFLFGVLFCFVFVLPTAVKFLLSYKTQYLKDVISVGRYIDFCLKFILAFGAIFELPVVMVLLTKAGIVTPDFLAKHRKYSIVLAFVIAAFLTPTWDAFNQTLMAVPIILFYEVGIWASRFLTKKKSDN